MKRGENAIGPAGESSEDASVALQDSETRAISSAALFCAGRKELVIAHQGEQYRLRQTRNGKLILTK